jgi:Zn-dependent peptidase ImmA (M78 family)
MNVTDKARELLIKQDISSFDINLTDMRFNKKIIFDTVQNYSKTAGAPVHYFEGIKDGCTIIVNGVNLILTRKSSPTRTKWTLAHEIGHVHLGHTKDNATEERQANCFACELLMPELVILELNKYKAGLSSNEIARLFGVSIEAAAIRLKQINNRERFSPYLKRELMEKYEALIQSYVKSNNNKNNKSIKTRKKLCPIITL